MCQLTEVKSVCFLFTVMNIILCKEDLCHVHKLNFSSREREEKSQHIDRKQDNFYALH